MSLPQYAAGISSQPRPSAFLHKPPTDAYSARHSIMLGTPQGWTPAQATRSSKVNCRKNFQQKEPMYPQCKRQTSGTRQPICVSKLLIKLPRQDTQSSSASYRGSFPCTTPRLPRYGTEASF